MSTLAEQIKRLGTQVEIITHVNNNARQFVDDLEASLIDAGLDVVVHDGDGMVDKYFNYDVQVLCLLKGQFFPNEHNKTMVVLDDESDRLSGHLTSSDKWIWNEDKQELIQRVNSDFYIDDMENNDGNSAGSWANILKTSFS